ncbi:hypothetical protein BpHYR1_049364 [Brachionus plicatilis]|uniref:Uncharacterized protein n=1 Tax=Brachionus plicatilis TaxID=10195 RepID=A0A3M7SQV1_BRAPC|nr:hypothetical protein BpHYR1_049364 [Brachionus plicatilis]
MVGRVGRVGRGGRAGRVRGRAGGRAGRVGAMGGGGRAGALSFGLHGQVEGGERVHLLCFAGHRAQILGLVFEVVGGGAAALRSLTATGASSGGGVSVMCFSFQCLLRLLRHLYVLPQMEHANLVMPSSSTLRYRAGSTSEL